MNTYRCGLTAAICLCVSLAPAAASAETSLPQWVYDALSQLETEGYVDLGGRLPAQLTRAELAAATGQLLHEIDRVQQGTRADEYGRITSLMVRDEAHLRLYQEQERKALRSFETARSDAQRAEEMLARQSMRGENRLEQMRPLQEKATAASRRLQFAARDYALIQMRCQKRALGLRRLRERQQSLFAGMTADAPASDMEAEPLVPVSVLDIAARLRAVLFADLADIGYTEDENAAQQLYASSLLPAAPVPRLKVDAEVRTDASRSGGLERGHNRSRVRARLYPDYDIDGNWHAAAMLEYEKQMSGGAGDRDGRLSLDRYYLTGRLGAVQMTAGVFGMTMAEGNIYDSKFRGIRFSAGAPITYEAAYGRIDRARTVLGMTASYDGTVYRAEAGVYRFDLIGAARNIYMLNVRRPLGALDFGAMALYGRDRAAGSGAGYVFTLARRGAAAWRPGASSYWVKYYRQPSASYVSHTMNGMADYMSYDAAGRGALRGGFRGWGTGWSYTVQKDLTFSLEYFDLRDLSTHARSRTIWGALTGYFKNYGE